MSWDGLKVLLCAGTLLATASTLLARPPAEPNPDNALAATLAVQTALQQGREHLLNGEYRAAVTALESQLAFINGNKTYLKYLQDAYRGYVKELRLAKQDAEAQRYLRRLLILDRGALLDSTLTGSAPSAAKSVTKPGGRPAPTVRAKNEEDPFHPSNAMDRPDNQAKALLAKAEQKFGDRDYREARLLYEKAHEADQSVTDACRERWAYCKLFCVVERLNENDKTAPAWPDLERDVRHALELAPRLDYGKSLLAEIQKRQKGTANSPEERDQQTVEVRHEARGANGYALAETANFRIFHTQSPKFAEQAARVAERTRTRILRKWFASDDEAWNLKCDLYLHATAEEYGKKTGQYNSPGHSTLRVENGRLVVRRIDLHCEDANVLTAILPHETTHVVLAGQFGAQLVPRWADEGMAVLTEPKEKIERHRRNLLRCQQDGQLYSLQNLLKLEQYPETARGVTAFYAQSVSLVEFLSDKGGAQEFTFFLHDSMRYGYEKALQRHYGYKTFAELEESWSRSAFRDPASPTGVAQRSP